MSNQAQPPDDVSGADAAAQPSTRTIRVAAMARVEGEGALTIHLRDGRVDDVQLRIFEAPRFFEALLRGRSIAEVPDITARICGICPVAYQMSACHALEALLGFTLPDPLRALRRLLYCGEWIESHVLHIAFLHAPDFLGYESAFAMAQDRPEFADRLRDALQLKKAGNAIVDLVGGRAIHPINVQARRVLSFARQVGARSAGGAVERRSGNHPRPGSLDGEARLSAVRARLRIRGAAARVGVPDERRPARLQPGPGHRDGPVPRTVRGVPGAVLQCLAVPSQRRRCVFRRSAGPLELMRGPGRGRNPAARPRDRDRLAVPQPLHQHRGPRPRNSVCG